MPAYAESVREEPQNVISITRHAFFKKVAPAADQLDPVEMICHEILKPLAVINNSARKLSDMPLGQTEKGLVETIASSCKSAMQYSRDVQKTTRVRRLMLNSREFRPRDLLSGLLEAAREFAFLNEVDLSAALSPDVPEVLLAPDQRIAELLGIFLNNAIRKARGKDVRLVISGRPEKEVFQTLFRVEAPAVALSEEAASRIATFQQANALIASMFCGRGTGLASCKGLAARLGGHISIISDQGKGVAIEFALPCSVPGPQLEPLLLV